MSACGRRNVRQRFEQTHDVVAGNADQSAAERHLRRFPATAPVPVRAVGAMYRDRRVDCRAAAALAPSTISPSRVHAYVQRIAETEERIARQLLAALDALQQIARRQRCKLQISRYRRIQVRCDVEWCLHASVPLKKKPICAARRWAVSRTALTQTNASPTPRQATTNRCCEFEHPWREYHRGSSKRQALAQQEDAYSSYNSGRAGSENPIHMITVSGMPTRRKSENL